MIYGKWLVKAVDVSHLERVFYTNTLGLPFLAPIASSEVMSFYTAEKSGRHYLVIFISCLVGVSIGYTSWCLRAVVSATSFSLVGVLNKMVTICVAIILWEDEGSTWMSCCSLFGCLVAGFFYNGAGKLQQDKK
jgi:hypothetical protein